jgi:hypothetical protein
MQELKQALKQIKYLIDRVETFSNIIGMNLNVKIRYCYFFVDFTSNFVYTVIPDNTGVEKQGCADE